jgi:hypothetical protein
MNNSNDMMFDYMLQMGAIEPQQIDLARRQAMVDALRKQSMQTPQGQMVSGHYVPPSFTDYLGQLGQGYMAQRGQQDVDTRMEKLSKAQRDEIERIRRERMMRRGGNMPMQNQQMPNVQDMYMNLPSYGNEA